MNHELSCNQGTTLILNLHRHKVGRYIDSTYQKLQVYNLLLSFSQRQVLSVLYNCIYIITMCKKKEKFKHSLCRVYGIVTPFDSQNRFCSWLCFWNQVGPSQSIWLSRYRFHHLVIFLRKPLSNLQSMFHSNWKGGDLRIWQKEPSVFSANQCLIGYLTELINVCT